MSGRYLDADERKNGKLGLGIGLGTTPLIAFNLARQMGSTSAVLYGLGMVVLLALIGLQIRASRLRDEAQNG